MKEEKQTPDTPPVYTLEQLLAADEVYFLQSRKNGHFVAATADNGSPIRVASQHADKFAIFQFVRLTFPGVPPHVKIWNLYHRQFLSAIGDKWPLFPQVQGDEWSRFDINVESQGLMTIKSLEGNEVKGSPWVSLPLNDQQDDRLRICEVALRPEYSYFQPYAPVALKSLDDGFGEFVETHRYRP